jgi:hypothetical protein
MMRWHVATYPDGPEPEDILGFIPTFLNDNDPRPAAEQINENYAHGGGWRPQQKFTFDKNGNLRYPGDPPFKCIAATMLRDEMICLYEHALLMIMQPDGSFEVSTVD